MMNLFGKRVGELTKDDLNRLCDEKWPEDTNLEFKENLPAKDGGLDSWHKSSEKISDYARNEIVREVIAFANAHGGTLFIGIEETGTKPAQAKAVAPLPNCGDLADRIQIQCRDMIDPQIPLIEVASVPISEDGSGIVVIRVPQSRMGPHRHKANKECYARRGNRTEAMTMREIQDLTLQVERGLSGIERRFEERRAAAHQEIKSFTLDAGQSGFLIRATAIPVGALYIERVHNNEAVKPPHYEFIVKIDGQPFTATVPSSPSTWRPILRGSRSSSKESNRAIVEEVHCDGLVEYRFLRGVPAPKPDQPPARMYPGWFLALVMNCLLGLEKFRRAAGAPEIEYGLDLEILPNTPALYVTSYGHGVFSEIFGPLPEVGVAFPRYSVGPADTFAEMVALIERDFWHAAGVECTHKLEIEFSQNT